MMRQLCEPVPDHLPTHIGKAEIAALETVGQLFMLQSETMEHGGVEVVDVDRFVLDTPSKLVTPSVNLPTLEAAPGHKHREGERMMVAPG